MQACSHADMQTSKTAIGKEARSPHGNVQPWQVADLPSTSGSHLQRSRNSSSSPRRTEQITIGPQLSAEPDTYTAHANRTVVVPSSNQGVLKDLCINFDTQHPAHHLLVPQGSLCLLSTGGVIWNSKSRQWWRAAEGHLKQCATLHTSPDSWQCQELQVGR